MLNNLIDLRYQDYLWTKFLIRHNKFVNNVDNSLGMDSPANVELKCVPHVPISMSVPVHMQGFAFDILQKKGTIYK